MLMRFVIDCVYHFLNLDAEQVNVGNFRFRSVGLNRTYLALHPFLVGYETCN